MTQSSQIEAKEWLSQAEKIKKSRYNKNKRKEHVKIK
jgi:hypothetical protein